MLWPSVNDKMSHSRAPGLPPSPRLPASICFPSGENAETILHQYFFPTRQRRIEFLNLFLLPVTSCDFRPCLATQSLFNYCSASLIFTCSPIRTLHRLLPPYQRSFRIHAIDKNDLTRYAYPSMHHTWELFIVKIIIFTFLDNLI